MNFGFFACQSRSNWTRSTSLKTKQIYLLGLVFKKWVIPPSLMKCQQSSLYKKLCFGSNYIGIKHGFHDSYFGLSKIWLFEGRKCFSSKSTASFHFYSDFEMCAVTPEIS